MLTYAQLLDIYDCECEDGTFMWAQAKRFGEWYGITGVTEAHWCDMLKLNVGNTDSLVSLKTFYFAEHPINLSVEVCLVFYGIDGKPDDIPVSIGGWFKDVADDGVESLVFYPED